jgi:hypothetical protein
MEGMITSVASRMSMAHSSGRTSRRQVWTLASRSFFLSSSTPVRSIAAPTATLAVASTS